MSDPQSPSQSKRDWRVSLPILVAISLVAGPLVFYGFQGEADRWRIANATEKIMNAGDYDTGIAELDAAIKRNPDSIVLRVQRSQWNQKANNDLAALADLDHAKELLKPGDTDEVKAFENRIDMERVNLMIRLQQLPRARTLLDELQTYHADELKYLPESGLESLSDEELERLAKANFTRNNISYYLARANYKLDDAEVYARGATRDFSSELLELRYIAELYFFLEEHSAALETLNVGIEIAKSDYAVAKKDLAQQATDSMAAGVPLEKDDARALTGPLKLFQTISSSYCHMLSLRAEVYRRLEQFSKAKTDDELCKSIGKATKIVKVDLTQALNSESAMRKAHYLGTSSAYIDTRGCVHYRMKRYEAALKDFDRAIRAVRVQNLVTMNQKTFGLIEDVRERPLKQKQLDLGLATLLYHRMLTRQMLGDVNGAKSDEAKIQKLGFQPSETLF